MILLRSQKNKLYDIVVKFNIDIRNLKWASTKYVDEEGEKLFYSNSSYYFSVYRQNNSHYRVICSPYFAQLVVHNDFSLSWVQVLSMAENWAKDLAKELVEPDKWDESYIASESLRLIPSDENDNRLFSYPEFSQISQSVESLRGYFLTECRDDKQRELVNAKLDYLVEASKRMGRKDWINICTGILASLATGLALDPEKMRHVGGLLKASLGGLLILLQ